MNRFFKVIFCLLILINTYNLCAQNSERPFIWVKQEDKANILHKIKTQYWAKTSYEQFKNRLDADISLYKKSPYEFLNKIPFDRSKQKGAKTPPLKVFYKSNGSNAKERYEQFKYLQIGIDCGVLYYLTEDESYAQCALDILYAYVEGLLQIKVSKQKANGGWIYQTDHLREARVIGAQLPIIYDFVSPYLNKNKKAFDVGKNKNANFSIKNAQKVFSTYAKLVVERGHTGSNWSVLESYSLVQNALAINNLEIRNTYLNYYLKKGTNRQDALPDVSKKYKNDGDVYPETSQYSNGVATYTTPILYLLNKYQPSLELGKKHYKIPFALDRWNAVRYPNNEIIRFGDGHRKFFSAYLAYDMAYLLGKQDKVSKLTDKFGPLLTKALHTNKYKRGNIGIRSGSISVYRTPLALLWLDEIPEYPYEVLEPSRTDKVSHAGVFLQRNLSKSNKPEDGLMCFVGGAHMVHGHASGMDMELFGLGEVLGVDHGRGKYKTDLHENYSRLFAAHNSVIVNGGSQGGGDWVNLGMNSVSLITMEPMPLETALSPNHSFTRTKFIDDKGDKSEATQERTMALIRTSPTTGFYMDVFRSKSSLPNEYHDYLYHNIGDKLMFFNEDLKLKSEENRFMANANDQHIQNGRYKNPGWHFFKEVHSSGEYKANVQGTFEIKKLKDENNRYMNFFILGNKNREYTKVMAPNTFESPEPYDKLPTPTMVIRQKNEAWTNPFAVIYEPTFDAESKNGIQSVSKLENKGVFKGFKVLSNIDNRVMIQYIINQGSDVQYKNKKLKLDFKGEFATITFNENKKLQNIYLGKGFFLKMKNVTIESRNNIPVSVYIDFTKDKPKINATENAKVIIH